GRAGEIEPEHPVAAVLRERAPQASLRRGALVQGELSLGQALPARGRPRHPADRAVRMALRSAPVTGPGGGIARLERGVAEQPDERERGEADCNGDAGCAKPRSEHVTALATGLGKASG